MMWLQGHFHGHWSSFFPMSTNSAHGKLMGKYCISNLWQLCRVVDVRKLKSGVKGGLQLPSLQTNWSGLIIQAIIPLLSIDLCIDKNIVKNKIKLPGPLAYHANALYTSGLQLLPLIAQVNKESQSRVHQIPSCDLTLILPVMHHTVQYTVTELVALCSK